MVYIFGKRGMRIDYEISSLISYEIPAEISEPVSESAREFKRQLTVVP